MFGWLHTLPDVLIIPIFVLSIVSLQFLSRWFFHKYLFKYENNNGLFFDSIGAMTVALSLILGLAFVEAKSAYKDVQMMISNEASQINNLDNILVRVGTPEFMEIHHDLLIYTESIISDEWPALAKGYGSERTRRLFIPINKGIFSFNPENSQGAVIYDKAVALVGDIMESRIQIIQSSQIKLDRIFWLTICTTIVFIFLAISFTQYSVVNLIMNFFYVSLIASLIAFIFIFDGPFKGTSKISLSPIQKVLQSMRVR